MPKRVEAAHRWPDVLPGSHAILFSIAKNSSSQVAVFEVAKRTNRVLVENGSTPRYAATGHLLYYRSGALFAAPFDAAALRITGPEAPVVELVAGIIADGGDYSVSDGGTLAYVSGIGMANTNTVLNWAIAKATCSPSAMLNPGEPGGFLRTCRTSPMESTAPAEIMKTSGPTTWRDPRPHA